MAAPAPLKLFCATSNAGKLRDFRMAAGDDIQMEGLPAVPCPEDGDTFEQNAVSKVLCYSRKVLAGPPRSAGRPLYIFADDSGLEVDALDGAPGVHSARFSGPHATDLSNNQLLIERLKGVPAPDRSARFVCCIALARDGQPLNTFQGAVEGRILEAPKGSDGFGYDPLFFYPALSRTFGELTPREKWAHSHRGKAFRKLLEWLRNAPR